MSKVLEKIVHEQSIGFLDKHSVLYKFQSGFQKNHSADFCLSYLTDKISKVFDSGLLTGVILIDLQKAFDTIDHNILLLRMPSLGVSREVIDWYKSYLSSRKFHVKMLRANSLPLPIYDAEFHKDPFLDLCYFCCI